MIVDQYFPRKNNLVIFSSKLYNPSDSNIEVCDSISFFTTLFAMFFFFASFLVLNQ